MENRHFHFRRFEFKYPLSKVLSARIIPQILKYMDWDDYAVGDSGYEVYSLYLDSSNFLHFHDKLDGLMNRKKIRMRSYKKKPEDYVFFEIKRKNGDVILKDRDTVDLEDLEGFLKDPFSLLRLGKYRNIFFNEFVFEMAKNNMREAILVHYKRKPFFSKFDKSFRVTFDHDIAFAKPHGLNFDAEFKISNPDMVVMEVKFNGAMPKWFHEIIEMHSLTKDTYSKYCVGLENSFGLPTYF